MNQGHPIILFSLVRNIEDIMVGAVRRQTVVDPRPKTQVCGNLDQAEYWRSAKLPPATPNLVASFLHIALVE